MENVKKNEEGGLKLNYKRTIIIGFAFFGIYFYGKFMIHGVQLF